MSLTERLLKVGKKHDASTVTKSKYMTKPVLAKTKVHMLNVALGGTFDSGIKPGARMVVGDSRTFKTGTCLLALAAFLEENPDGTAIFMDCEFGASYEYFDMYNIDKDRVIHVPFSNVEELKFKIAAFLDEIKGPTKDEVADKVFIFIDSIGNVASKKEVEDALNENEAADMTRAKALNSFWRIVTPQLSMKCISLWAINHYYDQMKLYAEKVIKGGKQGFLSCDDIWYISRAKIKDGTELSGYRFNINAMKSRTIKEGSVIPLEVTYDGGVNIYSGLLDVALVLGFVEKPKNGWFSRPSVENDKLWRRTDTECNEFWGPLLTSKEFPLAVKNLYGLSSGEMFRDDLAEKILEESYEEPMEE